MSGSSARRPVGEHPDITWAERTKVLALAERIGAHDHAVFGGRLSLEPGNFVERGMVRDTPAEYRDRRDWGEIRKWARAIAETLAPRGMATRSGSGTSADGTGRRRA